MIFAKGTYAGSQHAYIKTDTYHVAKKKFFRKLENC